VEGSDGGGADLQHMLGVLTRTAGGNEKTGATDRSAFVPNAATLVANMQKMQPMEKKTSATATDGQHTVDMSLERRKMENALVYSQRLDPKGSPKPYLDFSDTVQKRLTHDLENFSDEQKEMPQGEEKHSDEEVEEPQQFARQTINYSAYSQQNQKTLKLLTQYAEKTAGQELKTVAEIYNFAKFALSVAKDNFHAYKSQKEAGEAHLQKLRGRRDPKSTEKCRKKEELLQAISEDAEEADKICEYLSALVDEMDQRDGQRIKDGFNIMPKAFAALEEESVAKGELPQLGPQELSVHYLENMLQITSGDEFYRLHLEKYPHIDFPPYVDLSLRLLSDDMRSGNPTRDDTHLTAVRNALFAATICHQICQSIGDAEAKLQRVYKLRQWDDGTFKPSYMHIRYGNDDVLLFTLQQDGKEDMDLGKIDLNAPIDAFGQITEFTRDFGVDEFILAKLGDVDAAKIREFRRKLLSRYGLPVASERPSSANIPGNMSTGPSAG
jgi:hypothetical protein